LPIDYGESPGVKLKTADEKFKKVGRKGLTRGRESGILSKLSGSGAAREARAGPKKVMEAKKKS
jgi:hypothetical protein